jgi:tetrahydromethanopterin S-methyltransferase subunit G
MRKLMISLVAAGTALAFATPAAAQYYPQQYGGGYGQQYGGRSGWGQARELQARLDNVERQINRLDRRNMIPDGRADRLRYEANNLERQLRFAGRNGLNPYEVNSINTRISQLERQVQYSVGNRYGREDDRYDRDHQRGRDHDGDRDDDHDD